MFFVKTQNKLTNEKILKILNSSIRQTFLSLEGENIQITFSKSFSDF